MEGRGQKARREKGGGGRPGGRKGGGKEWRDYTQGQNQWGSPEHGGGYFKKNDMKQTAPGLWCCHPFSAPPTPRKILWCWLCFCKRLWKGLWASWDKAEGQRIAAAEVGRVQAGETGAEEQPGRQKDRGLLPAAEALSALFSPAASPGETPSLYLLQPGQRAQGHHQGSP